MGGEGANGGLVDTPADSGPASGAGSPGDAGVFLDLSMLRKIDGGEHARVLFFASDGRLVHSTSPR